jgi:hypothetical protein
MRKMLLSMVAASALLAAAGAALAESTTTTTTTWRSEDGALIREHTTTQKYSTVDDPSMKPKVGVVLPEQVQIYSLPQNVEVSEPERYSYTIINGQPVVVERSTRRIVHIW